METDILEVANWPSLTGNHGAGTRLVHEWCGKLSGVISSLLERIKVLETDGEELKKANADLKLEILELKNNRPEAPIAANIPKPKPTKLNFTNVFRTDKDDRISEKITISKVAREIRNEARKENNVVISGLAFESTQADEQLLCEIMAELSLEKGDIKKNIRLKRKNTTTTSNSQNSNSKPPLMLVEFNSAEIQRTALRNAKKLKNSDKFKDVYVNADRTAIERMEDKVLREERDKRNRALPNESDGRRYGEFEGKKFYWGVRGDRLQRIECKSQ